MKSLVLISVFGLLVGCSSQSSFDRADPIDNALKACGLGYSSDVGGAFRAAYKFADKNGEAGFEAKMIEGLETQIGALSINESFNKDMASSDKIDLIKSTQDCVIKYTDTYRPKSRSDLVKECMSDLQQRASGIGSRTQVITVKNWMVNKAHPKYSDENPVVYAELDKHSTDNPISQVMVQCKSNNYSYSGFEPVEFK